MPKPGSKEWYERRDTLLAEESTQPERWHYCSFADDSRGGFLGALFIRGRGTLHVSQLSHMLGLNPGGQMMCVPLCDDDPIPKATYCNVLLDKQRLKEAVGEIVKMDGTSA